MEKAVFTSRPDMFHAVRPPYTRLYYGNEFCQRLLPSVSEVKMAVGLARARKVDFSLVTPYVTDAGLERLRKLFSFLSGTGIPIEIIINDWGVLWTVVRDYPRLKPVLGRLLTKQKRCPTIPRLLRRRPRVVCSRDPAAPGLLRVLAEKKLPAEADVYYKG